MQDFETQRLSVTHWDDALSDDSRRRRLMQDLKTVLRPKALAFLPPSFALSQKQGAFEEWIAQRQSESDVFLATSKTSGALIGLVFLVTFDPEDDLQAARRTSHLGYMIAQSAWGKGYASELIAGVVKARGSRILAGVAHGNGASVRVLLKNGFEKLDALSGGGVDMFEYDG